MADTVEQRLAAVMQAGDVDGARALLDDLDGEELTDARRAFATGRRWLQELTAWNDLEFDDVDRRLAVWQDTKWISAMCAVRLTGPVTAARRVPWREFWTYREDSGEAAFVHLLWDTDPAWVADFVEAASQVRLGMNAGNSQELLARVLRAAALHHALPCPTGSAFVDRWWSGTGRDPRTGDDLADLLAADPFMPELLPLYLGSGDCGTLPALPSAVADLVERGVVDREQTVDHVLQTLTAPQRPKSQKVLGEILERLGLTAAEVPGGLDFLLGVMATADRSVVASLVPVALDAVQDGADLEELSRVVSHRPEQRPRELLLTGLRDGRHVEQLGRESVLASLALLRTGEDAAFDAKIEKAVVALGGAPDPPDDGPSGLGLWDLEPSAPGPTDDEGWRPYSPLTWDHALTSTSRRRAEDRAHLVARAARALADGRFGAEALLESFRSLLQRNCLSTSSLAAVFEDLFLGGGMRSVWPVALLMTDEACAATPRPSSLADLLRTMARYAVEVPRPWGVPPHIRHLAVSKGSSKARAEARALASALIGDGIRDSDLESRLADVGPPDEPPVVILGRWTEWPPRLLPLPSDVRTVLPGETAGLDDLEELRHRVREQRGRHAEALSGTHFTSNGFMVDLPGLTSPDLALATVVRVLHDRGADAVRSVLDELPRYPHLADPDVLVAVDLWATGDLDVSTFWTVAGAAVVTEPQLVREWHADRSLSEEDREQRRRSLPPLAERLEAASGAERLVVPQTLGSGAERLHFLRACEALIRAETHPTMLSTPTWADGTLELDDLLERLADIRAVPEATVGPVDLVQALHRLRPVERARAEDVPDGPPTDPRFTHPRGRESWDAGAVVREWVAAGGLPDLDAQRGGRAGWCTEAAAPVPFTRLAALPPELRDDPWNPGPVGPTARMMPLWPDRTIERAFVTIPWFTEQQFPGHLAARGGLPLCDRLLAALESDGRRVQDIQWRQAWPSAADFAQRGRLDPRTLATAGVMRHQAGVLDVAALAESIRLVLEAQGAFGWWWAGAASLADVLCRVPDPPEGLANLLRLLATYAHEVPVDYLEGPTPGVAAVASGEIEVAPATRQAAERLAEALARRPR